MKIIRSLLVALSLYLPLLVSAASEYELPRFIQGVVPNEVYPGADQLGELLGAPPVVEAFSQGRKVGYVFLNSDFADSTGYSSRPIHHLVAIDLDGVIQQVVLVEHHEPIVLIGIPESRITGFLEDYRGLDIGALARNSAAGHKVDIVTGATVTVMVMDDSILRSAIKVARRFRLGGLKQESLKTGPRATIRMTDSGIEGWEKLQNDGAIRNLSLTLMQINEAFIESDDSRAADRPETGNADDAFIDLYAAVVSVPTIGASLLGANEYKNLVKKLKPEQHAIVLAGNGRFSFKGSGYVRGGIFDRFRLIQGDIAVRFHDFQHKRLRRIAAEGAPEFKDVDIFRIPEDIGFDPASPWRLELLVGREVGPTEKAFLTFDLNYSMPNKFLILPEPTLATQTSDFWQSIPDPTAEDAPLWMRIWVLKLPQIIVLSIAISALTILFFFQNALTKYPVLTDRIRVGYLVFTLVGIGWYANAQLSIVNILTVGGVLGSGFDWSYFLMEPLIFILWASVGAAILFWGRGPYCGWLCPFGALQELLNRLAKLMKIPQVILPWGLHERMWVLKYLIFLALFGFSLHSLAWAERLAEIEPFKTAIILKFQRDWPFVLFAVSVLVPGLFIERFYCRYLCPLGAALAIPGRMRMFAWLKRYKECGTPCQHCASECMVQAIHPEGNINVNECLYCLHCQVVYVDDHVCPVMVEKRKRVERRAARSMASDVIASKNIVTDWETPVVGR